MEKYLSFLLLVFSSVSSFGQPLRDINYEYLYNPDATVNMDLRAIRDGGSYTVLYDLEVKDTAGVSDQYSVEWEGRMLLSDKEGSPISLN